MDSFVFQAKLELLESVMAWIQSRLVSAGFAAAEARKIELAMEEALVNVIHYAYTKEKKGNIEVSCHITPGQSIAFVVSDQGRPFNPLIQKQKLDLLSPLEERKEGGLGIALIRSYMDDVHYERCDPFNRLTLIKRL